MATPTANSVTAEVVAVSGDQYVDPLLFRGRWAGSPTVSLSFSFPGASSVWNSPYSEIDEPSSLQPFGASEADAARAALRIWSRYANIDFVETSDTAGNVGDIRFAYSRIKVEDSSAHTYLPSNNPRSGDIWFDPDAIPSNHFGSGDAGSLILLHEIGHALGLKHPFEGSTLNPATLDPEFDTLSYTVMSYHLYQGLELGDYGLSFYPTTPMPLDIAAIQYLYGAKAFNGGDTQYVYNEDSDYHETIYDSGGNDTIVWNSGDQFAIIDLRPGNWSSLGNALYAFDRQGQIVKTDIYNVVIYPTSVIENAIAGASDDDIYGNDVANRLEAGGGHDIVWGGAGADTMIGGAGNDHLYGQSPSGGTDGSDSISGDDGSDYLQGNAGNDILDGGDGSDRINGGGGDDSIFGMTGNDTINGNLGADTISGGDGNDSLRGGQGGDSIAGGGGNDVLSGDLGADTLSGGEGSDLFLFNGTGSSTGQPDRVTDFQAGVDRLSIGFSPAAILTGFSQTGADQAASIAQQLFDARAGNAEIAIIAIGTDSYLFYGSGGGATVDSAIVLAGFGAALALSDFG